MSYLLTHPHLREDESLMADARRFADAGWPDVSWENDVCPSWESPTPVGSEKCEVYVLPEHLSDGGQRYQLMRPAVNGGEPVFVTNDFEALKAELLRLDFPWIEGTGCPADEPWVWGEDPDGYDDEDGVCSAIARDLVSRLDDEPALDKVVRGGQVYRIRVIVALVAEDADLPITEDATAPEGFGTRASAMRVEDSTDCLGHPAGPNDPMGQTVFCDGSCRPRGGLTP